MGDSVKYNSSTVESLSLRKGDFYIGTGDVQKGPSNFWNTITPLSGGYTIYLNKPSNGPSIYTPNNDTELIFITNQIAETSFTTKDECLSYYAAQNDKMIFNRPCDEIVTDGLKLYVDAGFTVSYPRNGVSWGDVGGGVIYDVKNIGIPLTSWYVRRSDISLITDGSIQPPFPGAEVWSSTINTAVYANTLHRTWPFGSQNGIIGNLGQGYYRYYMWVRGKSTNSPTASISIDISDGSSPGSTGNIIIGTNEEWQLLSCWDNGGSSYNASKFFDYFLTGSNGDTYYISGIAIVRSDVSDSADLKPMFTLPVYMDYDSTTTLGLQGILTNGPLFNDTDGGAITFDGSDDSVSFSTGLNDIFQGRNPYTVELWLNQNSQPTGFRIVASMESTINSTANREGINIMIDQQDGVNSKIYSVRWVNNEQKRSNLNIPLAINTPLHIVGTYDGTNIMVYVNAVAGSSVEDTDSITNNETFFALGRRSGGTNYFSGKIYIARIYNRALTQDEVIRNYDAQKSRFGLM